MKRAHSPADYFGNKSGQLSTIVAHAKLLEYLTQIIHRHLDPQLARHCQVANIRGDTLVLNTDSPAWATRLRFAAPELVRTLHSEYTLQSVRAIRIRIEPLRHHGAEELPARSSCLSRSAGQLIRDTAHSITDTALSEALLRLAQRTMDGDR